MIRTLSSTAVLLALSSLCVVPGQLLVDEADRGSNAAWRKPIATIDLQGDGIPERLHVTQVGPLPNFAEGELERIELWSDGSNGSFLVSSLGLGLPAGIFASHGIAGVADVDLDGVPDVVMTSLLTASNDAQGLVVTVWPGRSSGQLGAGQTWLQVPLPTGRDLTTPGTLIDVDGDGRLDLVGAVQDASGDLVVSRNVGGAFAPPAGPVAPIASAFPSLLSPLRQARTVAIDVDGDGREDVVSLQVGSFRDETSAQRLSVALQGAGGVFASPVVFFDRALSGTRFLTGFGAGDLDGDGRGDVVITTEDAALPLGSRPVALAIGYGADAGSALPLEPFASLAPAADIPGAVLHSVADFDGDGRSGLLLQRTRPSGLVEVVLARPSPARTWTSPRVAGPAWDPAVRSRVQTLASDLDGDGDLDVLALSRDLIALPPTGRILPFSVTRQWRSRFVYADGCSVTAQPRLRTNGGWLDGPSIELAIEGAPSGGVAWFLLALGMSEGAACESRLVGTPGLDLVVLPAPVDGAGDATLSIGLVPGVSVPSIDVFVRGLTLDPSAAVQGLTVARTLALHR